MKKTIYLDYAATTPIDPAVIQSMQPYFEEIYGNSVSTHTHGWEAENGVQKAREQVANLLGCPPNSITFTSGATESNNWVFEALYKRFKSQGPMHILVGGAEHASVTQSAQRLAMDYGVELEWLPVNNKGQVTPDILLSKLKPHTKLVSVMWVQNELGSINPIEKLSKIAKAHGALFHTDATQALGKVPIHLASQIEVDYLSASSHKIYGPKGVGLLYQTIQEPELHPLLVGGGHEGGRRSGTLPTPLVVGFGKACELLSQRSSQDLEHLKSLRNYVLNQLGNLGVQLQINTPLEESVPSHLNLTFLNSKLPPMILTLAVSRASACQSQKSEMSPTLKAIGLNSEQAQNTLRLSLGRMTDIKELEIVTQEIQKLLNLSKPVMDFSSK